ncbi:uncharacterized protein JCM10292_007491 [Rhodotorula paludigena]|uniref:uncharacterized protein n=1 Tax=Rhodotorula paludigena TaxID=86838 RepID=UPI00317A700F
MDSHYPQGPDRSPPAPARDSAHDALHDPSQGSPPLVPIPQDADQHWAPGQSVPPAHDRPPYDANPYDRNPSSSSYYARPPPPDDPAYRAYPPQQHPGYREAYPGYPPPPRDPYYGRPPPPGYGGYPPPRSAAAYPPPPDPYGRPAYPAYPPPRDPYGAPPHSDYYARPPPPGGDYYARPPAPPPAPAHSSSYGSANGYPAAAAPRTSHEPAPAPPSQSHGPPPDPNDLSIPLLYLARSVSPKTFAPLRSQYLNLELRFVNSLLDLANDLHAVSLEHPNLLGGRRRVWVTAVGGTDALVARVRGTIDTVLDWREAGDLQELERELALEDRRVVTVRAERAEQQRRDERERDERREREREDSERERGRREIEDRERERFERDPGAAGQMHSEPDELSQLLRAVRGEEPTAAAAEGAAGIKSEEQDGLVNGASIKRESVEREGSMPGPPPTEPREREREHGRSQSPARQRKRSRREDDDEPDEDKEQRRAERKRLEAVCKMPRRRCVDSSLQQGIPVNDETRLADDEPQLGERHKGIWDLFGEPLDDVSPQIQVLMARAMRDVTYPPRLRLYNHPEADEQLQQAVPWFVTLLKTIKDRYELAGADTAAPLDPPLAGPFATLPESSTAVPTLNSLNPYSLPPA